MKIYRVSYFTNSQSSHGFSFHTSLKDAKKERNKFKKRVKGDYFDIAENDSIDIYDVPITAKGIMSILKRIAIHPDNG